MPGKSSRRKNSIRAKATPKKRQASIGRKLTTQVGSLIRPPELHAFLRAQRDKATYHKAAFGAFLRRAIPALRLQRGFARIAPGRRFMAP